MAFDPDVYIGPFHELLGLEIEHATDGTAPVTLDLERKHFSQHHAVVAQGGRRLHAGRFLWRDSARVARGESTYLADLRSAR